MSVVRRASIPGKLLIKHERGKIITGKIVEVEAYRGRDDPASHSFRGKTDRNRIMFDKPGLAYVYLCYGMYYLFNISTEKKGEPGAVLLRALEPLEGIDIMRKNRRLDKIDNLTNGPGKLTLAFNITMKDNCLDLCSTKTKLGIYEDPGNNTYKIKKSGRIGISKSCEKEWRFYIAGNRFVSK